jgi:hypothetical protein
MIRFETDIVNNEQVNNVLFANEERLVIPQNKLQEYSTDQNKVTID